MKYQRLYIYGFIFGILLCASVFLYEYRFGLLGKTSRALTESLPTEFWKYTPGSTPEISKLRKRLWLSSYQNAEVGVESPILESSTLFQSVFPGYESLRQNKSFWKKYFKGGFQRGAVWSPLLNGHDGISRLLSYNSQDCPSVFEEAGADLVVLGTSETYLGMVWSNLQKELHPKGFNKILNCAQFALTTSKLQIVTEELKAKNKKAKAVLLGYTFWQHYENTKPYSPRQASWITFKGTDLFPIPSWSSLFKFPQLSLNPSNPITIEPVFNGGAFWIPRDSKDINEISNTVMRLGSKHAYLSGSNESDCDLQKEEKRLHSIVASVLTWSDHLYIYIPPVTPFMLAAAPKCFWSSVTTLLNTIQNKRVTVRTGGWQSYGLELTDYYFHMPGSENAFLDINHTSYSGAEKVTHSIAQWIKQ